MNKKGEKIISVYWFAILAIVAGSLVIVMAIFYGEPYDIRRMEANAITNQIAECISPEPGKINPEIFGEEKFKESFKAIFLKECNLNFNSEEEFSWKDNQYYVQVEFFEFSDYDFDNPKDNPIIFSFNEGNPNLNILNTGKEDEEWMFPLKVYKIMYLSQGEREFLVKITSIVGKNEKNLKK